MEESVSDYAKRQLAKGKKPKDVIQTLIDVGYEAKEAKQAVKQAKKKTHHTIAAIGIVLALAVVVLVAYNSLAPTPTTTPDTTPTTTPASDTAQTNATQQIIDQAITQQDASLCDQLKEQQDQCRNKVQVFGVPESEDDDRYFQAMAQADPALCAEIEAEHLRTRCKENLQ